jgi:hypothetical protein
MTNDPITRAKLIERLAEVSHQTWMRQKKEQSPPPPADPDDPTVTRHDRERAEDIVAELERIGLFPPR